MGRRQAADDNMHATVIGRAVHCAALLLLCAGPAGAQDSPEDLAPRPSWTATAIGRLRAAIAPVAGFARRPGVLGRRLGAVVHMRAALEAHAVADQQGAKSQLAHHLVRIALDDVALVQRHDEILRRLGAHHQPAPQLFTRQRVDERVEQVIDLDKVFEFHLAIRGCCAVMA